jgi:hypothetical protein
MYAFLFKYLVLKNRLLYEKLLYGIIPKEYVKIKRPLDYR